MPICVKKRKQSNKHPFSVGEILKQEKGKIKKNPSCPVRRGQDRIIAQRCGIQKSYGWASVFG
jgi:hypothetical protein